MYMEFSPSYEGKVITGTVCKLRKALYGLKPVKLPHNNPQEHGLVDSPRL